MMNHISRLLPIWLISTLFLTGCAAYPSAQQQQQQTDLSSAGFVTLFLNQSDTDSPLQISISNVEVFAEPLWYPLDSPQSPLQATENQQLIAAAPLASDSYTRIRFQLTVSTGEDELLRQEQAELRLAEPFDIKAGSSHCLFIKSQITLQTLDQPLQQQLRLVRQQRPLADEILYILCPAIQTLYVAKIAPLQIVAAYGVGEDIADMVLDKRQKVLYLLDRRYRQVQKFDAVSQSLADRIALPLTDRPSYLGLSDDGHTLYVSDPSNQKILQLDARTGNLLQQRTASYQPGRVHPFTYQQQSYLAVLYPNDQQLQVLSAATMAPLYNVPVGVQPADLAFSDQALFVSDRFSRQLLKINPLSGNIMARINTAFAPGKLVNDPLNRNLLIGLCRKQAIAFLPFGQQLVARRVEAGGCPEDLALARQRRLLFAALGEQQQIKVFDLPSEKQIGTLSLATRPGTIVFQESW